MIAPRAEVLATQFAEHGGRRALANGGAVVRHDFSVCLNAFGPAEAVSRAIAECRVDEYPDPHSHEPRAAAAARWGCEESRIVFGAGAAELIYAACFAFLRPGDRVVIGAPAFGEYARAAELCGATTQSVNLFDAPDGVARFGKEIARIRPRLAFLTTPANPTGDALTIDELRPIADACESVDSLLVLDQAYDAFTAAPLGTPALGEHPVVLHLRSMTKEHALAGVRVAFAVASPEVADALERARVPWAASSAAQAAGVATMTDAAIAHATRTICVLRAEAARISGALSQRGIGIRASTTHFFLIRCSSARVIRDRLLADHGILVRDCTSFGLPEWLRVAARTPAENDVLIDAFERVLV